MNVGATQTNPAQAKWTVLLYSAADNNLTRFMVDDIKECETVGSDSFTKVVCQVDQGDDIGAARYLLEKAETPNPDGISSPMLEDMGQIDMANPDTLANFITWGMNQYPAEHTMLIISDHGDGWNGAVQDMSAGGTWMTSPMLREAFEKAQQATGKKLDIIGMDACLMANTEFAHEVKDCADYLIASEKTEGGDGWAYSKILNPELIHRMSEANKRSIDLSPREVAVLGVSSAATRPDVLATMSAIDNSKVAAITTAFDHLGSAILDSKTKPEVLSELIGQAESFSGYTDAVDMANQIIDSRRVRDKHIKEAAREVVAAVQEAVIAEQHTEGYPGAHGITIEPHYASDDYKNLKFATDNHWVQALEKLAGSHA